MHKFRYLLLIFAIGISVGKSAYAMFGCCGCCESDSDDDAAWVRVSTVRLVEGLHGEQRYPRTREQEYAFPRDVQNLPVFSFELTDFSGTTQADNCFLLLRHVSNNFCPSIVSFIIKHEGQGHENFLSVYVEVVGSHDMKRYGYNMSVGEVAYVINHLMRIAVARKLIFENVSDGFFEDIKRQLQRVDQIEVIRSHTEFDDDL